MTTDQSIADEGIVYEGELPAEDPYALSYETGQGTVYTVSGGDWDSISSPDEGERERIVVNMGPQHPSTHGVLRRSLELEGETVIDPRARDHDSRPHDGAQPQFFPPCGPRHRRHGARRAHRDDLRLPRA